MSAECVGLLVGPSGVSSEHSYSENPHEFARLVAVKDRGGLYFASIEVFKLVKICEHIFREVVVNKPMLSGNVLLKLKVTTQRWIHENTSPIFVQVAHANPLALGEISHEGQLVNKTLQVFFTIRLKYRGKIYTDDIINKLEASTRNLAATLTVFKHR